MAFQPISRITVVRAQSVRQPETARRGSYPMRILGLDVGIASCGWAVLDFDAECGRIVAAGARCFDPPLVPKTREPKSAGRRAARGQRRVIHRRRLRMNRIRELLARSDVLPEAGRAALADAARRLFEDGKIELLQPWTLRKPRAGSRARLRRVRDRSRSYRETSRLSLQLEAGGGRECARRNIEDEEGDGADPRGPGEIPLIR